MGSTNSSKKATKKIESRLDRRKRWCSATSSDSFPDYPSEINTVKIEHFRIISKIGKGSFGKVYAVEKKSSKQLFAMKIMDKELCLQKEALGNIEKEKQILEVIDHPFLITLWYNFEDEDNIYLVFEHLPGGDLRRTMKELQLLPESRVLLYLCEVALALDYLKQKHILHRDVKPENLLLDGHGHIRLIDFNIAMVLEDGELANSMSGTMPYIAPEVYKCVLDLGPGYSFEADWWSLGVCAYEMLCGKRPFDIHSNTPVEEVLAMFLLSPISFPSNIGTGMLHLISQMLCVDHEQRISSVRELQGNPLLNQPSFSLMLNRDLSQGSAPQVAMEQIIERLLEKHPLKQEHVTEAQIETLPPKYNKSRSALSTPLYAEVEAMQSVRNTS